MKYSCASHSKSVLIFHKNLYLLSFESTQEYEVHLKINFSCELNPNFHPPSLSQALNLSHFRLPVSNIQLQFRIRLITPQSQLNKSDENKCGNWNFFFPFASSFSESSTIIFAIESFRDFSPLIKNHPICSGGGYFDLLHSTSNSNFMLRTFSVSLHSV